PAGPFRPQGPQQ
nr:napin - rape (fragments) [Brassica napus]